MTYDFFSAALGLMVISKEKAEEMVQILVEKGDLHQEEAIRLVNRLIEKGKEEIDRYGAQTQHKVDALKNMFVTKDDLKRMEEKIDLILSILSESKQ